MSRPAAFTQADILKLIKAAKAGGANLASVEIDRTGKIVAKFGPAEAADETAAGFNEWDEVLTDGQAQRAPHRRN